MWHGETDFFALAIFVVMLVRNKWLKMRHTYQEFAFSLILWTSILSVAVDIVSSIAMNGVGGWWFYQLSLTIYYITMPLLSTLWMCYAITIVDDEKKERLKKDIVLALLPYGFFVVLAASNPFTGFFFTLSSDMIYARGILFWWVGVGYAMVYPFAGILYVWYNRHQILPKSNRYLLISFFAISIISLTVQLANPGWLVVGASFAVIYVLCDMTVETEHRNALYELLQKQNESLAEATRVKAEFFTRASHDMRTPMNGILGLAELSLSEDDPEKLRKNIVKIKESGQYMLELINDTLDMQKIERGKMSFHPRVVKGRELFEGIVDMVTATAKEKNLCFELENVDNSLPEYLFVDPIRIKQIFVNLLSNAIKFTPEGGTIKLCGKCISREGNVYHGLFQVIDTGVGMSESYIKNDLFQPFAQESNALTGRCAGLGLGLAITKNLIDCMGGRIEVKSELGHGTTFSVYLDIECAKADEMQEQSEEKTRRLKAQTEILRGKKVLLCEDNALNSKIATQLLENAGMTVFTAADGEKGIACLEASEPGTIDAVVMDMLMPVMDGLTATQKIRQLPREDLKNIPIIAMTANAMGEDMEKAEKAGVTDYLSKPIDVERLYQTLARTMQTRQSAPKTSAKAEAYCARPCGE